jgi:hypothetical protein
MSLSDVTETTKAQFVVPPLGGSVRRRGIGSHPLPPKGGTAN